MGKGLVSIPERTFKFGVRIVRLSLALPKNSAGLAVSSQIIRSGTSIGANIEEAQNAASKRDFIRGMTIALKEARETLYWLRLLADTDLVSRMRLKDIVLENQEIVKILTTSIKRTKSNCKL